jgi:hypothetical protein
MGVSTLCASRSEYPSTFTFTFEVDGGVAISTLLCATGGTFPLPIRQMKVVIFVSTCGTPLRRSKESVHLHKMLTFPWAFVWMCGIRERNIKNSFHNLGELAPFDILDKSIEFHAVQLPASEDAHDLA